MRAYDSKSIPLTQACLIEASAGTGKTYTIAGLYIRLICEGYAVEQILVVTFTEAAAAELKIRIRQRLVQSLTGESDIGESGIMDIFPDFFGQENIRPVWVSPWWAHPLATVACGGIRWVSFRWFWCILYLVAGRHVYEVDA